MHHRFAEERIRFFTGREDELAGIARYLLGAARQPLVVHGEGGIGKTALMGEAVRRTLRDHPTATVLYRFVGATPGSSDDRALLRSLCQELARRTGDGVSDVPSDYAELVSDFSSRLARATQTRPIIVFVDSLDQLPAVGGGGTVSWVPLRLPVNARLVVSTRPGDTLDPLEPRAELLKLRAMPGSDGAQLLEAWLRDACRRLQVPQRAKVLDKFKQSGGNPLYLRLAFEEARRWTAGSGQPPEDLAVGVKELILRNLFERLEHPQRHGRILVSKTLGYLAASRHGLAEDELLDLLSRDFEVYRWFLLDAHQLPQDLEREAARFPDRPTGSTPAEWLTCIREAARILDLQPWRLYYLLDAQVGRSPAELAAAADMNPERGRRILTRLSGDHLAHCELGQWTAMTFAASAVEGATGESPDAGGVIAWGRAYRSSHAARWPFADHAPTGVDDDDTVLHWYRELPPWRDQLDAFLRSVLTRRDGPRLPVVLWSRLSFDLEPYLTERRHEGADLIAFFHREFHDVAEAAYAEGRAGRALHSQVADYFYARADRHGSHTWGSDGEADLRGLSELPYHLTRAERWEELVDTLTDFRFLEQKALTVGISDRLAVGEKAEVHTGVFRLQDDLDTALRYMPGGAGDRSGPHHPIVTAVDFGEGLVIRCPYCNRIHPYRNRWRGRQVDCPNPDCNKPLKIAPFVVDRSKTDGLFVNRRHDATSRNKTVPGEPGPYSSPYPSPYPGRYPGVDPQRATALNRKYHEDLARWNALPWWKRLRVPRPERPTGI